MANGRKRGTPLAPLVAAALLLSAQTAMAQPEQPAAAEEEGDRFADRDTFVLSIERFLGFQSQEFGGGDNSPTYDSTGMQPIYWGNVGLFGISSSGLALGTTIGFTYFESNLFDDDDDSGAGILRLGPRIGYAGSTDRREFGYWVRGGPTLLAVFSDEEMTMMLAGTIELYAVIRPVEHLGILVGPHADIHITGEDDAEYSSLGLTFGLMGEFY